MKLSLHLLRLCLLLCAIAFLRPASAQKWTAAFDYGGSVGGFSDAAKAITTDLNGNVYMTGNFNGSINFGNGTPTLTATSGGTQTEGFVVKFNSAGQAQWAIDFGGAATDQGGLGIVTSADGSVVYVTGQSQFPSTIGTTSLTTVGGSTDGVVFALNTSTGAVVWAKAFGGGSTNDAGQAICLDANGNVYLSGIFATRTSNPTASFGASGAFPRTVNGSISQATTDMFVARIDPANGNFIWVSAGGAAAAESPSLVVANDNITGSGIAYIPGSPGQLVVSGSFASASANYYSNGSGTSSVTLSNNGQADICVLELDLNGNFLSGVAAGGSNADEALGITYDAATAATYITGYFNSPALSGAFSLTNSAGGFDEIYYARYNYTSNSFSWAKNASGSANDYAFGIASFGAGNVYITGRLQGTTSFPTANTPLTSTSSGSDDIFLVKVDGATGNALSLADADATTNGTDAGLAITTAPGNNLWVSGIFAGGTLTFVPSSPPVSTTANLDQELFLAQYNDPPPAVVTTVSVPANGTYAIGQTLTFTVNFNIAVTVTTTGGTPSLPITIGSTTRNAAYISGSGSTALTFRYTVVAGDFDNNGIVVGSAIALNGGGIQNTSTTVAANLTLNTVGATTGVNVDGIAPTVNSSNRLTPGTNPTNATTVVYRVTFSEMVTGVNTNDFTLTTTSGSAIGTISSVSAATGTTFDVTVTGVSGNGDLRLDLKASGTGITDGVANPIASGYTSGQTFTIDNTTATPVLTSPASGSNNSNPIRITATLPEAPQSGSVEVVFDNGTMTTVLSLVNSTSYNFLVNINDPTASPQVTSSSAAYIAVGNHTVTLRYRDALGNPVASTVNTTVRINQALPVKLAEFSVVKRGTGALLNWKTTLEENTDRFEVEYSVDGRTFVSLSVLPAVGNRSTTSSYTYSHSRISTSLNYYRLKVVDRNGKVEFSPIRQLDARSKIASVSLYPNPAQDRLTVRYGLDGVRSVSLLTTDGRVIKEQVINNTDAEVVFNVSTLPSGQYLIRITAVETISLTPFLKN